MLLYAITSRQLLANTESECAERLVALASKWAAGGVNYIQIRERDLPDAALLDLATRIVQAVRRAAKPTKVLINSNPQSALLLALESDADGVHLPGGLDAAELAATVDRIREGWLSLRKYDPIVSVSCHSAVEVRAARAAHADVALFAPVFEKALPGEPALSGQGLESLARACSAAREPGPNPQIALVALGGVSLENASQCMAAGAAGIAAIRLFLESGEEQSWRSLLKAAESNSDTEAAG